MKIEIVVDGEVIHTQQADKYYAHEYHEMINTLSAKLGVRLGEQNLTMDQICMGVDMLKLGWSVDRLRAEMWRR